MTKKNLKTYLLSLGVDNAEEKTEKLWSYTDEIMLFNPPLKLVGSTDSDDILLRHILDCASAYPVFLSETKEGDTIADLGSGAGLPGIVLAVLFPGREFFLIERMTRRVGFLRSTAAVLKLGNVHIVDRDISDVKERYSLLTCRAFHPLSDIAEHASLLAGNVVFYKGTADNVKRELDTLRTDGWRFEERTVPVTVPGLGEERNIVVLHNWEKE